MNASEAYNMCRRYHGRHVRITDRDGRVHEGHITRVDRNMVWIRPQGGGGYGLGWGWGWGWGGGGFGYGIALGAITGIALSAAFFW
ncbi:hypothetical protein M3603_05295 [Rummeliibacillus stabekisii]|uniref:hypothetical protein n=1 Tax=Rummeliibacillus stabekisii TaxID=241244 RepID=UPI002041BF6B|nr:hypothetical protein [Rummeliibacillus stabekisii]MCM3316087.1 hypothetical protein [Rummeliibacillus stabekisii]